MNETAGSRRYKAALFDLDDTLLRSSAAKWMQHQVVGKRHYGIDITEAALGEVWGMPLLRMIELLYPDVAAPETIREVLHETNDEFPKLPIPGAAEAVTALLDAGIQVGVITGASTKPAIADLKRLDFPVDRMLCVLGEDVLAAHKPAPEVFEVPLQLLSQHGITAHDTVYVGDLLVDCQAALAADFDFIAVTSGLMTEDEHRSAGAPTVTSGITEAASIILDRSAAAPMSDGA